MFFRQVDDDLKLSLSIPQYAVELFQQIIKIASDALKELRQDTITIDTKRLVKRLVDLYDIDTLRQNR